MIVYIFIGEKHIIFNDFGEGFFISFGLLCGIAILSSAVKFIFIICYFSAPALDFKNYKAVTLNEHKEITYIRVIIGKLGIVHKFRRGEPGKAFDYFIFSVIRLKIVFLLFYAFYAVFYCKIRISFGIDFVQKIIKQIFNNFFIIKIVSIKIVFEIIIVCKLIDRIDKICVTGHIREKYSRGDEWLISFKIVQPCVSSCGTDSCSIEIVACCYSTLCTSRYENIYNHSCMVGVRGFGYKQGVKRLYIAVFCYFVFIVFIRAVDEIFEIIYAFYNLCSELGYSFN